MKKRNLVFLLAVFSLAFIPFINVKAVDTKVEVTSYDEDGITLLNGATLQVLDENDNVVVNSWTTENSTYTDITQYVQDNAQYYIHELAPPKGYALAEDVPFTVVPNQEQTYGVVNKSIKLTISKVDEDGNKLEGALFQLKDEDENVIDSWVSTTEAYAVDNSILEYGKQYTIVETKAPIGYVANESTKTFTIDSENIDINLENKEVNVTIANYDGNGEQLAGVDMQIQDEDGNIIEPTFSSSNVAHEVDAKLEVGKTYYIVQVSVPNGYNIKPNQAFTVTDNLNQEYSITNERVSIVVNSLDQNDNAVANVKYDVLNSEGQKLFDFTTGNTSYTFTDEQLDDIAFNGTYKIVATGTTDGYILDTDEHEFTVNQDSTVVNVSHTRIIVAINNYKEDNVTPLNGAKLQILKASDNSVVEAEWTTDGYAHQLSAILENNTTYKIHQTEAPKGYALAEDVTFTVNDDATQLYTIKNDKIKISVLKTDNYNEPLAGALLQLIEKDGNNETVIDSWTSTTEAYEIPFNKIEGILDLSKTHILRETTAPTGYVTTSDQTISIISTGEVQEFTLSNNPNDKTIVVRKLYNTTPIQGAVLQLYEGEEVDSDKLIYEWTTPTNGQMRFGVTTNTYGTPLLKYGRKYTVHEVTAPNGYVLAPDHTFTINNELVGWVDVQDKKMALSVTKVDEEGNNLSGSVLQLKDGDTVLDTWTTNGNAHTVSQDIVKTMNYDKEYTIHEVSAPNGYAVAQDRTFKFSDFAGETASIEIENSKFAVTVSNYDENNALMAGSTLHIENEAGNTIGDEWITTEDVYTVPAETLALMSYGTKYYIVETDSPAGYGVESTKKEFTIDSANVNVSFYNFRIGINIINYDSDGQTLLDGTTLKLIDKETDNEIESWNTSNSNPYQVQADLEVGKDYIIRIATPKRGYIYVDDVEFKATSAASQNYSITNKKLSLGFTKVGKDNQPLAGATLAFYEEGNNDPLFSWTSTEENYIVSAEDIAKIDIDANHYLLEVNAPSGYITPVDNIPVEITKTDDSLQIIRIENDLKTVNAIVKAIDGESNEPVNDVEVELYEDDTKIDTFTIGSEGTTLTTTGDDAKLVYGKSYTLHIKSQPNGYVPDEDLEFTVDDNFANNTEITFELDKFSLTISKIGSENALIGGAELELLKADGTSLHTFTTVAGSSYTVPAEVLEQISYGDVIKLRENKAPAGYLRNTTVKDITINTINVTADFANTEFGFSVNNVDKETTNFLSGTTIQILNENKDEVIEEWTTDDNTGVHVVEAKLEQGSKYYLHVTGQANGYIVPEDTAFIVSNEEVQSKTLENEKFQLTITKVDENGDPLEGALLSIYEEGSTTALASWNSTQDNPYVVPDDVINQMNIAKNYVVRETQVPSGYDTVTEDFPLTINNVSTVQNIQIQNNLKQYDVNITAVDESGATAEGATIELYEGDYSGTDPIPQNKLVATWTSTNGAYRFSTIDGRFDTPVIKFGTTYTIRASKTPRNIEIDNRETFTINENSDVTINKNIVAEKFDLTINKLDENGEPLGDAKLALYKADGTTLLDEFITSRTGHKVVNSDIHYGDILILKELEAPAGYTISSEAKLIAIDSNDVVVNYTNIPFELSVANVDATSNEGLAGTELQLKGSDGTVIDTWNTSDNETTHVISNSLKVGETYYVHVVTPSTGYRPADDIEYTVTNDTTQTVTVSNNKIKINITKYDEEGNPLSGAKLGLYNSNDEKIDEWTSTTSAYEVPENVILGIDYNSTLTVKELESPEGYYIPENSNISFNVNYDQVQGDTIEVAFNNSLLGITVNNMDADGNTYLPGTELQLLDSTKEEIVEEWTAGENVGHLISSKLKVGNKYYVHVKTPTTGHIVPEDVEFTVNNSATQIVEIVNPRFSISIAKKDSGDNLLAGALLKLKDGETELDSWVSTTSAYVLPDNVLNQMTVGHTYTIVEVQAPIGYDMNQSTMNLTVANTDELQAFDLQNTAKNIILNVDVKNDDTVLTGAQLQLISTKEENGELVEDEVKATWTTDSTPETFSTVEGNTKLVYGATYIIRETKASNGYIKTDDVQVRIVEIDDDHRTLNVTLQNEALDVRIDTRIDGPETGKNGDERLDEVTFGLYTDAAGNNAVEVDNEPYTWTSSNNQSHKILALLEEGRTYYVKEIDLPDGYDKTSNMAFTVQSTGDTQTYTFDVKEHELDVRVKKVSYDNPEQEEVVLRDAEFALYNAKLENGEYVIDGDAIYTWVSKAKENNCVANEYSEACGYHKIPVNLGTDNEPNLHVGKYIIREVKPPIEYQAEVTDTVIDVVLTNRVQNWAISNRKTITHVIINKQDSDCPEGQSCPVNGSVIRVHDDTINADVYTNLDDEGNPISFPIQLDGLLIPGHKYSIIEDEAFVDANHAYQKAETYVIDNREENNEFDPLHTVLNIEDTQTYTLYNDKTIVHSSIINKDLFTDNQLKGAEYKIYQGVFGDTEPIENFDDLEPVLVWNTDDDDDAHDLSSIVKPGYTYTIVQTKVPYGYKAFDAEMMKNNDELFYNIKAFSIVNTVNSENTQQDFELLNDLKDITIEVQNFGSDDQPIYDSAFCIYKDEVSDENVIDCWDSEGMVHVAEVPTTDETAYRKYKFEVGGKYIIHQTVVPEGYDPLDEDIEFIVEDTEGPQPPAEEGGYIIYIENKKLLSLVINVIGDESMMYQPLAGITLQILDSEGNVILDEEGKPKYEWTTDETGTYTAVDLPAPNTYIIRQKKVPNNLVKARDIYYTLDPSGNNDDVTFLNAKKKVLDNPETGDSIIKYVVISVSALVAVLLGLFIYKKLNKKKG